MVSEFGTLRAREFSPKRLKAVRERMIAANLHRKTINSHVSRIKRMVKWAASEELLPGSLMHDLNSVGGLPMGRTAAKESQPVKPVAWAAVEAIQPFVSRPIWGLIQLQWWTGARSGELVGMRAADIVMGGSIWEYSPASHKNQHRGHTRVIYLGPQAQEVIKEFLTFDTTAFLFRPAEARKSNGNPGEHYRRDAYRKAVARGCEAAFNMPEHLRTPTLGLSKLPEAEREKELARRVKEAAAWRAEHVWHPHQLRHAAATRIRREAGIEHARVVLGHTEIATTQLYAEADQQKAREVMARCG